MSKKKHNAGEEARALEDETKGAIEQALATKSDYPSCNYLWLRPATKSNPAGAGLVSRSSANPGPDNDRNLYFPAGLSAEEILNAVKGLQWAGALDSEPLKTQALINSGLAWRLEGAIGRAAMRAIENGEALLGWSAHTDAYGNRIPARDEVQEGTKGSLDYVRSKTNATYAHYIAALP